MKKKVLIHCPVAWVHSVGQAKILKEAMVKLGFEVHFFVCKGGRSFCYQKLSNRDNPIQCLKCSLANRYLSASSHNTIRYSAYNSGLRHGSAHWSAQSSLGSSLRLELDERLQDPSLARILDDVQEDLSGLEQDFQDALNLVKPDICIIFNGRFHDTAAAINVCEDNNIDFLSFERVWFGSGIQIFKGKDCISVEGFRNTLYGERSVLPSQKSVGAAKAFVEGRLIGRDLGEWRNYGQKLGERKLGSSDNIAENFLIVPSSRSEFMGHPEYRLETANSLEALKQFIEKVRSERSQFTLRAHPVWSQKIGSRGSAESLGVYRDFCADMNVRFLEPDSPESTYDLMQASKAVITNGSSSVCEAIALGVPVVNLGVHRFDCAEAFPSLDGQEAIASFCFENFLSGFDPAIAQVAIYDMIARYIENAAFFVETSKKHSFFNKINVIESELERFSAACL